jgi:hypothetical protein
MKTDFPTIASNVQSEALSTAPVSNSLKSRALDFYHRHEKYAGLAIFGAGFVWDSLTMTRVDNPIDNIILLFYLVIIGFMIVQTLRRQRGAAPVKWLRKLEPYFLSAMQFCFGGLFSSYVIFYFKSASWTKTQFFFLLLVCLWIGNEFLHERLQNAELLSALYCFCLLSFLAFFLPVVLERISTWIFLLAGFLSLAISLFVFSLGLLSRPSGGMSQMRPVAGWILSTFFVVNALYFSNLIPPVPLALKSAGIYHHVARTSKGYAVKYVSPPFYMFWRKGDDPFYFSPGETVFCYTAIFAPRGIRVPVRHVWSYKSAKGWLRTDQIGFQISGGRDGGYRGFTGKTGILLGEWRVEVETFKGQTLGRIDFTVVPSPQVHPPLQTSLIR